MKIIKLIDSIAGSLYSEAEQFHQKSTIKSLSIQNNIKEWPIEWKHIHFKLYPRLKQLPLKYFSSDTNILLKTIRNRRSERQFKSYQITNSELAKLLLFSAGIITKQNSDWDQSRRAYPSAGARYPLETYLIILHAKDLNPGLYHYNIKQHSLELLLDSQLSNKIVQITGQEWVKNASMIVVVTVILGRSQIKYGERAYRYCLLEAGHLAQNMYLLCSLLKLKCCAIGGFIDKKINTLLDIDEGNEPAIYMIAVGK